MIGAWSRCLGAPARRPATEILFAHKDGRRIAGVLLEHDSWLGMLTRTASGATVPVAEDSKLYKVLTIAAGAFKMSIGPFILASIVARAMRFYLVAGLLYWFGDPIRDFIEKRLSLVTTAFVVLVVSGFVAVKYVF